VQTGVTEVWHTTRRAARENAKRLTALQGVLFSIPVLLIGSFVTNAITRGTDTAAGLLLRPFESVTAPLVGAYEADADLALLGYILWSALLLHLLWSFFAMALYRQAAVDLTQAGREDVRETNRFARRHGRSLLLARLCLWAAVLLPLALVVGVAFSSHLPGIFGVAGAVVAVGLAVGLGLLASIVMSVDLAAGFLPGPVLACEASDAFDAVGRTFTYTRAELPRLLFLRLLFFFGVVLGSGWRLLRTLLALGLGYACLRFGLGDAALDRIGAIWKAFGAPMDADRLGIGWGDYVLALAMALGAGSLALLWLADFVSRMLTARVAVYLLLRREVEDVPFHRLRAVPAAPDAARPGPRQP
jgi:hypothetical protein